MIPVPINNEMPQLSMISLYLSVSTFQVGYCILVSLIISYTSFLNLISLWNSPSKILLFLSFHKLQTVVPKAILSSHAVGLLCLLSCKPAISSTGPKQFPSLEVNFKLQSKRLPNEGRTGALEKCWSIIIYLYSN